MKKIQIIGLLILLLLPLMSKAQTEDIASVKAGMFQILSDKVDVWDKKADVIGSPTNIVVLDDRIEFVLENKNTILYFSDLLGYTIGDAYFNKKTKFILEMNHFDFYASGWVNSNLPRLHVLRNYFVFMQNHALGVSERNQYSAQLVLFEPIAAQYCALDEKPSMPEEQRRFVVQANVCFEQKKYEKAIEFYQQAVAVDPTAYPEAYSNMALLSAQLNDFNAAIYYMKKYIMLVPYTDDARKSQDKIYEWELNNDK